MKKQRQSGVALIEFALILPALLLLSFMAIDLGRAIWQYNQLTKSVRDAARYLSLQTPGTRITQARNLAVYGNLSGTGAPLVFGLTASNVPDPVWQTAGTAPVINTVTVRISGYTFTPIFASAFGVGFPTMTYSDITATMRSYL
jgi:hypothetical protein